MSGKDASGEDYTKQKEKEESFSRKSITIRKRGDNLKQRQINFKNSTLWCGNRESRDFASKPRIDISRVYETVKGGKGSDMAPDYSDRRGGKRKGGEVTHCVSSY